MIPNDPAVQEITQRLNREIERMFARFGTFERISQNDTAAVLYRNLCNILLGQMCSEIGIHRTLIIAGTAIEVENKHYQENKNKLVVIADGWLPKP